MAPTTFLVADDDHGVRTLVAALLQKAGYGAVLSPDGTDAIERLRRRRYDGLVLDLMMPRSNGFEVLDFLLGEQPHMLRRTVVITAASDATLRHFDVSSIRKLIRKPFDIDDLVSAVNQIATFEEAAGEMRLPITPSLPH